MAPGEDWAMAAMSSSSSSLNSPFFSTNALRTMGSTTYPPPKVNALMYRFTPNSQSIRFVVPFRPAL